MVTKELNTLTSFCQLQPTPNEQALMVRIF